MPLESGNSPGLEDCFYLSDVSPIDKPWDKHRASANRVGDLYALTHLTRYSERIRDCSRRLGFAFQSSDLGELKLRLDLAKFCRVRHCPVCQWRRSLMWRARFFKTIPKILEKYPSARFLFLTLTIRNCELSELKATITRMNKAWKLLTMRKQFPALGWVKSVEVTRGKNETAHPHFHIILMVRSSYFTDKYIKQSDWVEMWKDCLRIDYIPQVHIKAIKSSKKKLTDNDNFKIDSEIAEALCETLKYAVKEEDLEFDAGWLQELTVQLHKTRAISLGGIFKEYLSEDEPEDLIHTDLDIDEDFQADSDNKIWFGWREMVKRYAKE